MKNLLLSWVFWALLSAGFAALTAIFAKIGIENVNSDFATFIRTVVILWVAALIVYASGNWQQPPSVSAKTWLFLILSGTATGASHGLIHTSNLVLCEPPHSRFNREAQSSA
jgi:transporter family protein